MRTLIRREVRKFRDHWRLYAVMVFLFSFIPAFVKFLYLMYFPFVVTVANVQPFPVTTPIIAPGDTLTYKVDVEKREPFPGTVNRFLHSEKCDVFQSIQPPLESNRAVGRVTGYTTVRIPDTIPPCPYVLEIETVYYPNKYRALPVIKYRTAEFLVTNQKEELLPLKQQVENIDQTLKEQVIQEVP